MFSNDNVIFPSRQQRYSRWKIKNINISNNQIISITKAKKQDVKPLHLYKQHKHS